MTARISVDGKSITLSGQQLAELKLPGRDLFGPMTLAERGEALSLCFRGSALATHVEEESGADLSAIKARLANHITALS